MYTYTHKYLRRGAGAEGAAREFSDAEESLGEEEGDIRHDSLQARVVRYVPVREERQGVGARGADKRACADQTRVKRDLQQGQKRPIICGLLRACRAVPLLRVQCPAHSTRS